ncbi:pyridoxal phosphate-dependent aminotransferase [bacterium]|nr:pyridoxal phosphate-dependent aminotransferase [bacterium]
MRTPRRFDLMHWAKRDLEPAPYPLGGSGTRPPGRDEASPALPPGAGFTSFGDEGGLPPLREALARVYRTGETQVLVTDGASLANYTALAGLAGPGDRVVVETPTYASLAEVPRFQGATVVPWHRRPEENWLPRLEHLRATLREGPLAAVVLTRLHNPSGVDLPPAFLRELAELAETHDFRVLLDAVYLDFLPDAVPGFRFSKRFLSTGSLTKVQGFGGLRVGWILGDAAAIASLREVSYLLAVNASAPSQTLGSVVLAENERWLHRARNLAAEGRAILEEWMGGREDVSWIPAAGGLNAFVRVQDGIDTLSFAKRLREERGVALAAGEMFQCPGWVRISFSAPADTLREALRRTGEALDAAGATAR